MNARLTKYSHIATPHVKSFADVIQLHVWKLAANNGMHDCADISERKLVSQAVLLDNVLQYTGNRPWKVFGPVNLHIQDVKCSTWCIESDLQSASITKTYTSKPL
jgi:hypothetical protein